VSEITWTATRNVQPGDAEVFARLVEATAVDDTHILGGCRGGDALLARLLSARGAMVHVVLPADRSQIDPEWQLFCSSFEEMPGGTTFRQRDERMVELGGRTIGIAALAEKRQPYSGTWMTIRIARAVGKMRPEDEHILRP